MSWIWPSESSLEPRSRGGRQPGQGCHQPRHRPGHRRRRFQQHLRSRKRSNHAVFGVRPVYGVRLAPEKRSRNSGAVMEPSCQAGLFYIIDIAVDEGAREFCGVVPLHRDESLKDRRAGGDERVIAGLCHGNQPRAEEQAGATRLSCSGDGCLPLCRRFGSKGPQCRSGDEVALKIEVVVDGGMDAEEALCGSS